MATTKVRLLERDYVVPGAEVGSEHEVTEAEAARLFERGLAEPANKAAQAAKSDTPDDKWKNDDIRAYAAEHGLDLGDATTKKDMLAAIEAAQAAKSADTGQGGQQDPGANTTNDNQ